MICFPGQKSKLSLQNDWQYAIDAQNITKVKQMIAQGFDIEEQLPSGNGLILAVDTHNAKFVKEFVELGANVNAQAFDEYKNLLRPTMWAAASGGLDILKYLMTQGAEIELDLTGIDSSVEIMESEIGQAIFFGRREIIAFLLDCGVRISEKQINIIYDDGFEHLNNPNGKRQETREYTLQYQRILMDKESISQNIDIKPSSNSSEHAKSLKI